jgi:probable addiction module antidote protein
MMLRDFNEVLEHELRDPEYAEHYLRYAMEDGTETFLLALRDVAKANGGMSRLAEATELGRESMYKSLSEDGNPKIKTVQAILSALGLKLSVIRDEPVAA